MRKRYCRNCGCEVQGETVDCAKCGQSSYDSDKYCQTCGNSTQPDSVWCATCGWRLGPSQAEHVTQPRLPSESPSGYTQTLPPELTEQMIRVGEQLGLRPRKKSRITAGVFAILFGVVGLHKFYLGYIGTGIIMLIFPIVYFASIIGIYNPIGFLLMPLIGIIEGIIYLGKTNEEFNVTYVQGKKRWF